MDHKALNKTTKMNLSDIPVNSSLGLLAIGDITFVEWRKIKTAQNVTISVKNKDIK